MKLAEDHHYCFESILSWWRKLVLGWVLCRQPAPLLIFIIFINYSPIWTKSPSSRTSLTLSRLLSSLISPSATRTLQTSCSTSCSRPSLVLISLTITAIVWLPSPHGSVFQFRLLNLTYSFILDMSTDFDRNKKLVKGALFPLIDVLFVFGFVRSSGLRLTSYCTSSRGCD